jgi:hypothetical protein
MAGHTPPRFKYSEAPAVTPDMARASFLAVVLIGIDNVTTVGSQG